MHTFNSFIKIFCNEKGMKEDRRYIKIIHDVEKAHNIYLYQSNYNRKLNTKLIIGSCYPI